ncbi:MAG: hypothetical protein AABY11_03765, partial [archaeon]
PLAFEAIALDGASAAEGGVDAEWIPILGDTVQKNVRPAQKEVKGTLTIACTASDGVERVKSALLEGKKGVQNATVHYLYLGAGKYQIKVVSFDYKIAEKALSSVQEKVQKNIGSYGTMSFARQEA